MKKDRERDKVKRKDRERNIHKERKRERERERERERCSGKEEKQTRIFRGRKSHLFCASFRRIVNR